MKVFYDHKIFCKQERGGPSKYFLKLTQKLNETNVNAKIFAGFHLNKFLKESSKKNNIGFEKKLPFSNYLVNTYFVPKLNQFNEILSSKFIKEFNPDIIHTTYYNGNFDRYNKPLVVTVYDLIHEKLYDKKPGEVLRLAVKRMLPGGVLGRKQLTKLKIYTGSEHPHSVQNPKVIDLSKLNSKNIARI